MREHGPWKIKSTSEPYRDPWITVVRDEVVRPDGHDGTYATVSLKSGVCVIAVDEQHVVHLTEEFHYAVGRVTIEGVSGGIETGETPESTAHRELQEELGLKSSDLKHLGRVDPFTAAIYSTVDLYLARGLSECEAAPEGTELIQRKSIPLGEAVRMVRESEITHAPTCVGLLRIALDKAELPGMDG